MTFQGKYFVEDWMHPFVHTFSDFIVENVAEIENLKDKIFSLTIRQVNLKEPYLWQRMLKPVLRSNIMNMLVMQFQN